MLTVWPSWLLAEPRTTASTRSPSRSASGSRLNSSITEASPETKPSAFTSNAWQRPVGDNMPWAEPEDILRGSSMIDTPPARARSLS